MDKDIRRGAGETADSIGTSEVTAEMSTAAAVNSSGSAGGVGGNEGKVPVKLKIAFSVGEFSKATL
jgi:hypothetical protein